MVDIFYIVEDGKLQEYRRHGSCNRCGRCCCTNLITFKGGAYIEDTGVEENEENHYDWSNYENFSIFRSQGLLWYLEAKTEEEMKICINLDGNDCAIWMQDDFPAICRYWPMHPNNVEKFPECGFNFEKII